MVSADPGPLDMLGRIRDECLELGLQEGADFHVEGFPTLLGSEHVELRFKSGNYEIRYSDMGQKTVIARTALFDEARSAFVSEVARLAAGRNRGPSAGVIEKRVDWRERMSEEQKIEEFLRRRRAWRKLNDWQQ